MKLPIPGAQTADDALAIAVDAGGHVGHVLVEEHAVGIIILPLEIVLAHT